jgi:hypothetical protein
VSIKVNEDYSKIKLALLTAITKFDERQSKGKYYNIHAFPQYLDRLDCTMEDYRKGYSIEAAINNNFLGKLANTLLKVVEKIKELTLKEAVLKEAKFAISNKELEDAFPSLYKYYKQLYGSQRPHITVETVSDYHFAPRVDSPETDLWYNMVWLILHEGETEYFDSSDTSYGDRLPSYNVKLQPGDAILECHTGYTKYCTMYVHPDFMNSEQIEGPSDLLATEEWILLLFKSYIPKARYEYFSRGAKGDEYAFSGDMRDKKEEIIKELKIVSNEYQLKYMKDLYEFLLKGLVEKDLLKISSNGAAQLTMKGKNVALSLGRL